MRKRNEVIKATRTFGQKENNYELFILNENALLLLEVLLDMRQMLASINLFNPEQKE